MTTGPLLLVVLAILLAALVVSARLWRRRQAANGIRDSWWSWAFARGPWTAQPFDLAEIAGLPAAADRFLRFAIAPGTPVETAANIAVGSGETTALAIRQRPPERGHMALAPRHGCVRRLSSGILGLGRSGHSILREEATTLDLWRAWVFPIAARMEADRSRLLRRMAIESVCWVPGALLPGPGVTWREGQDGRPIVGFSIWPDPVEVAIEVDADGRIRSAEARLAAEPKGPSTRAEAKEFLRFGGYHLPTLLAFHPEPQAGSWPLSAHASLRAIRYSGPWIGSSHC